MGLISVYMKDTLLYRPTLNVILVSPVKIMRDFIISKKTKYLFWYFFAIPVIYVISILQVATKYKTMTMKSAFPQEFLAPLLRMSLFDDAGMRIIVQQILHTLIDRHDNTEKLTHVT